MGLNELMHEMNKCTAEGFLEYVKSIPPTKWSPQMLSQIRQFLSTNGIKVELGTGSAVDDLVDELDDEFDTKKYVQFPNLKHG